MRQRTVKIPNRLGLHARAAARFVHAASQFSARIRVTSGERTTDGKSILGILLLAASRGVALRIVAQGRDEEEAVTTLAALVESGFGELR